MKWLVARRLSVLACLALFQLQCTDTGLEPIPQPQKVRDDKLELTGELCTRTPDTLVFPLRVLFIVDGSISMGVTDPPDPVTGQTQRERAVRETWERLLGQGAQDVKFGMVRFSAQAQGQLSEDTSSPPDGLPDTYFLNNPDRLESATQQLSAVGGTSNFVNALGEAYFELRTEFLSASQESLPLSKYVVIFLSDGLPDLDDSEAQLVANENILGAVQSLKELAELYKVGDFSFNTAFVSSGQGAVFDSAPTELLKNMANVGDGSFRSFPNGEELNFLFVDLQIIERVFTLKSLIALNTNTVQDYEQTRLVPFLLLPPELLTDSNQDGYASCGEPLVDSDGDGLSDLMEDLSETSPLIADSDDDGLSDRVEWDINRGITDPDELFDPNNPDDAGCIILDPCLDLDDDLSCDCVFDSDDDGLCDCFEDPEQQCADPAGRDCVDADLDGWCDCPDLDMDGLCDYRDTDGDGLGDCEELYNGTAQNGADSDADGLPDPMEVRFRTAPTDADERDDLDWDLTDNGTEVLSGTDPRCEDAELRAKVAYRYSIENLGLRGASTCYNFSISNITLASTMANPDADWPGNGQNRVLVYASEVGFDDPTTFARFRVACVVARYRADGDYKNPPSGRIRLTEADFVDLLDFDPDVHCRSH